MRVTLLDYTEKPVKKLADIASICYGKTEAKDPEALVRKLYESGHHSVFEHLNFTFLVQGISRVCAQQLTRYRHMSFTMRSQRYTDEARREVVSPRGIGNTKGFRDAMERAFDTYSEAVLYGYHREDARYVLPQAVTADLYVTCNLRALIHLANERLCRKAQWEIRELTGLMCGCVHPKFQYMFKPKCQSGLHICRGCELESRPPKPPMEIRRGY